MAKPRVQGPWARLIRNLGLIEPLFAERVEHVDLDDVNQARVKRRESGIRSDRKRIAAPDEHRDTRVTTVPPTVPPTRATHPYHLEGGHSMGTGAPSGARTNHTARVGVI